MMRRRRHQEVLIIDTIHQGPLVNDVCTRQKIGVPGSVLEFTQKRDASMTSTNLPAPDPLVRRLQENNADKCDSTTTHYFTETSTFS